MSKSILVITGSPRKGGNSDHLAEAFINGAKSAGHTVSRFDAAFKKIGGCKACYTCWSKGKPCSFDDDFAELSPMLEAAEVIVFCTPVYWFGMSAQIKLAIDKFYSYLRPTCPRKLKIKESVLLTCAAGNDEKIFAGIIGTYKGIANHLACDDRGMILVPSVYAVGDISSDALARAEELGGKI